LLVNDLNRLVDMAAQKTKQPDWGKFGLDGEDAKGKSSSAAGAADDDEGGEGGGGGSLFGGQIQHDNELFADDQVR
jgi:hypothetical protein